MKLLYDHIPFLFTKVDCLIVNLSLGASKGIKSLQSAMEDGKKLHVQVEVLMHWYDEGNGY